ncbi:26468_t:CDS:1, partial [Gigaspora margarita]
VPYSQPINHFSQPFPSNTLTTLIKEENNCQTVKAINKLTHFINEIVNQTPDHIQPLQLQPITSNSDDNRFLYKCSDFTQKIPPNSTILTSRPVTSIMNDTLRLDSYERFFTLYNSKDNSILPKISSNQPLNTSIHEPQFHLAREYVFPKFAQKSLSQQQEKIKDLRSRSRVQIKESKSSSNLSIMEEEEVPPIAACKVPYSIVNDISNKDADITCGQLLNIKNNGSNK